MEVVKYLVAVLLILCWLPMPYEYYIIVRWAVMIAMIAFAFGDNKEKSFLKYVLYVLIGVLFNPIIIIELPRLSWNIIDLIIAALLLISVRTSKSEKVNQRAQ
jgi:hypothetical protein